MDHFDPPLPSRRDNITRRAGWPDGVVLLAVEVLLGVQLVAVTMAWASVTRVGGVLEDVLMVVDPDVAPDQVTFHV